MKFNYFISDDFHQLVRVSKLVSHSQWPFIYRYYAHGNFMLNRREQGKIPHYY